MSNIRPAIVAGSFYPVQASALQQQVKTFLQAVPIEDWPAPKALVVPHAGYIYSGAIAATAYARLGSVAERLQRVVLLGPSHRVFFQGLALSSAKAFASPLGDVPLDEKASAALLSFPQVRILDQAHAQEHSLEVHLPFLQYLLPHFQLIPIVVGQANPTSVAQVLEFLWGGEETLIVVSSDLSHYHDYVNAQQRDAATSQVIESLCDNVLQGDDACGHYPLNGLLRVAKRKGMQVTTVDVRNSGDTAGSQQTVVGYGAYVFH